ncbi:hypothetical protein AVEN_99599-1 [Araneus ventricosus]|uniref:Uncharacterized protein n=1 Tax=Araneus ventricosus TaxID=182803 RepID=A0A4Y2ET72_ARAVE|nr:hypothetical protein AVEN_99599-1 [Araneus ventricosus]
MQIVQKLQQRVAFSAEIFISHRKSTRFCKPHHFFPNEATFHVSNRVNISTTADFGAQEIPIQYRKWKETVQESKCCGLSHGTVIGPFFFAETSVTANIYLDKLQIYAAPQMLHLRLTVIFQQDAGARMFEHFAGTGIPAGYPHAY